HLSDLALDEPAPLPALEPAPAAERYPLSSHQERLWFIDTFETGTVYPSHPTYHNLPLLIHLRGSVSPDAVAAGLQQVVARHAALRTRVVQDGNELFQAPAATDRVELGVTDLTENTLDAAVDEALREARRPFALDR